MVAMKSGGTTAVACFLIIQFIGEIQCNGLLGSVFNTVGGIIADDVLPILQTSTTRALMRLQTVSK